MARKSGRGLFLGKEDFIPLERVDLLEDLKRLVDVHRLTDFSLSDKVVPTIELRRTEDEIVGAVAGFQAGGVGVGTFQLFAEPAAAPAGVICRPISITVQPVSAVSDVLVGYLPFSGGAIQQSSADPRRPVSDLLGTGVHQDATTVAMVTTIWRCQVPANTLVTIPESLLQRCASVAGQCFSVQLSVVGVTMACSIAWRVETPRLTRRQG